MSSCLKRTEHNECFGWTIIKSLCCLSLLLLYSFACLTKQFIKGLLNSKAPLNSFFGVLVPIKKAFQTIMSATLNYTTSNLLHHYLICLRSPFTKPHLTSSLILNLHPKQLPLNHPSFVPSTDLTLSWHNTTTISSSNNEHELLQT